MADRRGRRPQPGRAVEDVTRHVGADPPSPRRTTRPSCACTTHPAAARVLACRSCRALVRCARCDAAVGLADDGTLSCRRCGQTRPAVCLGCGASAFANLRPGVTRLREELEAAAGRPVVAITGSDAEPSGRSRRVRRHGGCRCTGCPLPMSSPSSTSTPSCWRRATGQPSRRWPCSSAGLGWPAPRSRRPVAAADVPAPPRGRPGGAAGRPRPDRRARARPPPSCSACRRSARWPRSAGPGPTTSPARCAPPRRSRWVARSGHWRCVPTPGTPSVRRCSAPPRPKGARVRVEVDPQRR